MISSRVGVAVVGCSVALRPRFGVRVVLRAVVLRVVVLIKRGEIVVDARVDTAFCGVAAVRVCRARLFVFATVLR